MKDENARQNSFTREQINLIERLAAEWLAGNSADDLEGDCVYNFIDFIRQFEEDVAPRAWTCSHVLCWNEVAGPDRFCGKPCLLASRDIGRKSQEVQ